MSGDKNPMFGRTGDKNPFYGKTHTTETKIFLAEKARNDKYTLSKLIASNMLKAHRLIDTETGIIYDSIGKASKKTGINLSSLKAMLSGRYKNKTNLIKL